jgi:hypothetical protein
MQRVRIETAHTHTLWLAHKTRCFVCFRALRVISAPPPHRRAADYAHRRICVSISLWHSLALAHEQLFIYSAHTACPAAWLSGCAVVINGESGINYTAEYVPCNNHEPTRSAQRRLGPPCMHLKRSAARRPESDLRALFQPS